MLNAAEIRAKLFEQLLGRFESNSWHSPPTSSRRFNAGVKNL
jgi:hypothetical protein